MEQELVDLFILLPGNHLPVCLPKSDMAAMDATLFEATGNTEKNQWLKIDSGPDRMRRVKPTAILGWYFQPRGVTASEQALKLMEKIEKKMPDTGDGENWKDGS